MGLCSRCSTLQGLEIGATVCRASTLISQADKLPLLCRFLDAGVTSGLLLRRPASKKRQGTKSRGGLGGGRQPALWGFDFHAGYGGGREAGAKRSG
jgi:hypothetical protein